MGILAPWTANPQTLSQRSAAEEVKGLTLRLPAAGAPSSGISWVMAEKGARGAGGSAGSNRFKTRARPTFNGSRRLGQGDLNCAPKLREAADDQLRNVWVSGHK